MNLSNLSFFDIPTLPCFSVIRHNVVYRSNYQSNQQPYNQFNEQQSHVSQVDISDAKRKKINKRNRINRKIVKLEKKRTIEIKQKCINIWKKYKLKTEVCHIPGCNAFIHPDKRSEHLSECHRLKLYNQTLILDENGRVKYIDVENKFVKRIINTDYDTEICTWCREILPKNDENNDNDYIALLPCCHLPIHDRCLHEFINKGRNKQSLSHLACPLLFTHECINEGEIKCPRGCDEIIKGETSLQQLRSCNIHNSKLIKYLIDDQQCKAIKEETGERCKRKISFDTKDIPGVRGNRKDAKYCHCHLNRYFPHSRYLSKRR